MPYPGRLTDQTALTCFCTPQEQMDQAWKLLHAQMDFLGRYPNLKLLLEYRRKLDNGQLAREPLLIAAFRSFLKQAPRCDPHLRDEFQLEPPLASEAALDLPTAEIEAAAQTQAQRFPKVVALSRKVEAELARLDAAGDVVLDPSLTAVLRSDPQRLRMAQTLLQEYAQLSGAEKRDPELINQIGKLLVAMGNMPDAEQQLAKYPIAKILGAGGFGVVYQCRDRDTQRRVAIKTLHMTVLEHCKNIWRGMACLNQGRREPWRWNWRKRCKPPTGQKILHRDIKPDNILVRREGERWVIRLVDFGFAARAQVVQQTTLTVAALGQTGQILLGASLGGTGDYAAPEQLGRIPGKVGFYSDVYSFDKTLCYALVATLNPTPKNWDSLGKHPLRALLGTRHSARSQAQAQNP